MTEKAGDVVQVNLRIPQALRRKLVAAARRNKRSLNAEMVHRLLSSGQAAATLEDIASSAATQAVELTLQRFGIKPKADQ
ncbi:Arc family DNA-binding protein [Bradyrhizobium sp. CCGUVB4N]|uniref:Arc family DNA-binding protein n=1 Tax=Bradyrhizobium sp. CCGUVB4N TaxID=2949631 RepID=UPI0020B2D666|nr:Arc family DNA-binding protein [Bradyrhizobium sp. CCGUVB4N]MCP3382840.1 Arc family DNA-binding protein [Bradyrhizobium sp. CCGUVB4N]